MFKWQCNLSTFIKLNKKFKMKKKIAKIFLHDAVKEIVCINFSSVSFFIYIDFSVIVSINVSSIISPR